MNCGVFDEPERDSIKSISQRLIRAAQSRVPQDFGLFRLKHAQS